MQGIYAYVPKLRLTVNVDATDSSESCGSNVTMEQSSLHVLETVVQGPDQSNA